MGQIRISIGDITYIFLLLGQRRTKIAFTTHTKQTVNKFFEFSVVSFLIDLIEKEGPRHLRLLFPYLVVWFSLNLN